jgi:predicted kinase
MRIVVVGTAGAGKTTLARKIAALLGVPHIELDAINWQLGWRDLTRHDPEEFVRRVAGAIGAEGLGGRRQLRSGARHCLAARDPPRMAQL